MFLWVRSLPRWWNNDVKPVPYGRLFLYSSFRWRLVLVDQQLHFLLVYAGIYVFGLLFLLRHTSAAHWDSDVVFRVHIAASSARGGAAQDDGGHVHGGAAEVKILLTKDPHEAALAQTVCFGNVFRVSCGVIRNSVGPGRGAAQVDGQPEPLVAARPGPRGAAGVVVSAGRLGL